MLSSKLHEELNKNLKMGIKKISEDPAHTPKKIGKLLFELSGVLNPTDLGEILSDSQNKEILDAYLKNMSFKDKDLWQALKFFLEEGGFRLAGEAQKIDRMMEAFARKYKNDNPQMPLFTNEEDISVIAFATIMLNTDLHNPAIEKNKKMSVDAFINNVMGIKDLSDMQKELKRLESKQAMAEKHRIYLKMKARLTELLAKNKLTVDEKKEMTALVTVIHESENELKKLHSLKDKLQSVIHFFRNLYQYIRTNPIQMNAEKKSNPNQILKTLKANKVNENNIGKFLYENRLRFDESKLGELLGESQNKTILSQYVNQCVFAGKDFAPALKDFLEKAAFRLPLEGQKIDRFMEAFGTSYTTQNPMNKLSTNKEDIYVIAVAAIMLNTDLHKTAIKKQNKMTEADFVKNVKGVGTLDILQKMLTHDLEEIKKLGSQKILSFDQKNQLNTLMIKCKDNQQHMAEIEKNIKNIYHYIKENPIQMPTNIKDPKSKRTRSFSLSSFIKNKKSNAHQEKTQSQIKIKHKK